MKLRTYSELIRLPTFEERFEYLKLSGEVGARTFGYDRYLNQNFYRSREWKQLRNQLIVRDNACDLGCDDHPLNGRIIVHHMNPITSDDIIDSTDYLMNPEFLIVTCHDTHNAIHYGDKNLLPKPLVERRPGDTCPWK